MHGLGGCLSDEPTSFVEGAADPLPINAAPVISGIPASAINIGDVYSFSPSASDADNDKLTFAIENKPVWASFNIDSGILSGQPTLGNVGVYSNILISVSDGTASASLPQFSIRVSDANSNSAPMISGNPAFAVNANTAYNFTPTASDPDNDTLSFLVAGRPRWASFDSSTGRLSGVPTLSDVGTYSGIVISVTDGTASASLAPFEITVLMGNSAPVISGTPSTSVVANSQYSFTPDASDPNGDSLAFSITGKPSWASFNTTTGRLSGTPDNNDAGNYANIRISVTDGQASASLAAFTIAVSGVNGTPTISGTPPDQINEGIAYSFTPTASDPDNDTLSFSVAGLPGWANFNTSNGRISGTPGSGDVGSYSGITITVSDGSASANLGPFSITVNAVSLGSVTLNWTPPTENDDGSALTDLAGYKIYWGTTPGSYPNSVTLDNPGLTSYVVDNLSPGTYEFVATSFNAAGVESAYSNVATKVLN